MGPEQAEVAVGNGGQQLAASLDAHLDSLERSFSQLCSSLQGRVHSSQAQTLEHLLLYDTSIEELQSSTVAACSAYDALLGTCRQLSEELRGVDLLAGRVAAVKAAVVQLEAQVDAVLAGAPAAPAAQ